MLYEIKSESRRSHLSVEHKPPSLVVQNIQDGYNGWFDSAMPVDTDGDRVLEIFTAVNSCDPNCATGEFVTEY